MKLKKAVILKEHKKGCCNLKDPYYLFEETFWGGRSPKRGKSNLYLWLLFTCNDSSCKFEVAVSDFAINDKVLEMMVSK